MVKADDIEQVWECPAGHSLSSPRGIKWTAAWCGICGSRNMKNAMRKVKERTPRGRLVSCGR